MPRTASHGKMVIPLFLLFAFLCFHGIPKRIPDTPDDVCNLFMDRWDEKRLRKTMALMRSVSNALQKNNIDFSLMAGTLLGFARHGGFIPWDDDVDFYVAHKNVADLNKLIRRQAVLCSEPFWGGIKLYFCKDALFSEERPVYPFIDIFSISPATCLVPFRCPLYWTGYLRHFSEALYFPTILSNFRNVSVRVPLRLNLVLETQFGQQWEQKCASPIYDHARGVSVRMPNFVVNCKMLRHFCGTPMRGLSQ